MHKTIASSLLSAGELHLPQDLDCTLVFVSFLIRYPSDIDNQIYSSSETRIWNSILLVLILWTASFQICLWISPRVHQCFVYYHSMAPQKIPILGGLSLVSSWKCCLFYCPFCYLQNVHFEGSYKSSFEPLCLKYNHYWSDYLLSSIQQSWLTYWLP